MKNGPETLEARLAFSTRSDAMSTAGRARSNASAYEVLGVDRRCTRVELKRAYNAALKQAHPDKGGDDRRFQQVQKVSAKREGDAPAAAFFDHSSTNF